ncbi:hypothetical protein [Labrenzia sp. VG12]|uniref:hypothetical protein n=1 Tax=Labrenzia sp. VG12 TaxID=2021862 RepID=UPI000B8C5D71|nr:hypothetical protein [Labrenzia sp. VG12]ASP33439.1 hypothetical protein CHH27_09435 [Labrenzia sp. VG12]
MRAILVTLLLMLFLGVNMAAAFSGAKTTAGAMASPETGVSATTSALELPHHACCEQGSRQAPGTKSVQCSADCLSLLLASLALPVAAEVEIERTSSSVLTAHGPGPVLQPPIGF